MPETIVKSRLFSNSAKCNRLYKPYRLYMAGGGLMPRPCVNRIEQIYYYKILMQKKAHRGQPGKHDPLRTG
jgi:hypothetical protein